MCLENVCDTSVQILLFLSIPDKELSEIALARCRLEVLDRSEFTSLVDPSGVAMSQSPLGLSICLKVIVLGYILETHCLKGSIPSSSRVASMILS